jgi:hypothetical protein
MVTKWGSLSFYSLLFWFTDSSCTSVPAESRKIGRAQSYRRFLLLYLPKFGGALSFLSQHIRFRRPYWIVLWKCLTHSTVGWLNNIFVLFSSHTLVAKAPKVVIMNVMGFQKFANFLHIPKFNLPDHPKQSFHFIFHFFFNLLSQIFYFHDNINLEKKVALT